MYNTSAKLTFGGGEKYLGVQKAPGGAKKVQGAPKSSRGRKKTIKKNSGDLFLIFLIFRRQ